MKPRHLIPALAFSLLIVYPLSIGPMWVLKVRTSGHEPGRLGTFINTFYAPLAFLTDRSETVHASMDWYYRLWVPMMGDAERAREAGR